MKKDKLIIIDFNRTIYDPENSQMYAGAREMIKDLRSRGYITVIATRIEGGRSELIAKQGVSDIVDGIENIPTKNGRIFQGIADKYLGHYKKNDVWVIGDYITSEIRAGVEAGFHTIWVRQGKFRDVCSDDIRPEHIIYSIEEVVNIFR